MNLAGAFIAGLIGAIVGACIWAAVSHYTGYEVGWVAWGIGGICGAAVAAGSRGQAGTIGGVLAVILSLLGIATGKWASVEWSHHEFFDADQLAIAAIADNIEEEHREAGRKVVTPNRDKAETIADGYSPGIWSEARSRWTAMTAEQQDEIRKYPPAAQPDFIVRHIADEIAYEQEEAGKKINWPPGMDVENAWRQSHYPVELWKDAEARWTRMSADAQQTYRRQVLDARAHEHAEAMKAFRTYASQQGFKDSLSLFDLLWVVLAVGTAFKLGSGESNSPSPGGNDPRARTA